MREIKFRVWDVEQKFMFYDINLMSDGTPWVGSFGTVGFGRCHMGEGVIFKGPVMQYTGLKDKKGKEIYEGDVLGYTDNSGILGLVEYSRKVQLYSDSGCDTCGNVYEWFVFAGFVVKGIFTEPLNGDGFVLGNIFENPELVNRVQEG